MKDDSPKNSNFVETADYLKTDRPFFVSIGKDGLIAALQKLDGQLQNVSIDYVLLYAWLTIYLIVCRATDSLEEGRLLGFCVYRNAHHCLRRNLQTG